MMNDNELLAAISNMIDEKFDKKFEEKFAPIDKRFDTIDKRLDRLEGEVKYIRIDLLENNVIPRLDTIERCYTDTY